MASAMAETCAWKVAAIALTQKIRMKKSKASSDQPRKQAMKVLRWMEVRRRKWAANSIRFSLKRAVTPQRKAGRSLRSG
jgi:hypothetical protein